jgi:hypothetical protein
MKKLHFFSRIFFVLTLAFSLFPALSVAQNGYILYGFRDVQQSSFLNPAFTSGATTVIGIPFMSNFSTGLVTTTGGLSNFFSRKSGTGSFVFDLSKAINNGLPEDKVTNFTDLDILFAGFRAGSTFITLGVRQHLFVRAILDRNLLNLLWNGDSGMENQFFDMSNTTFAEYHLMDYHVGISVPIGTRLRVGARIHLLQGLSDISTEDNNISMKTVRNSNGDLEVHARTSFLVNTSGLPDSTGFDPGKYFSDFSNLGFSIDLGADFQVTKQIWINASVLNWGKVYYNSNTNSYSPENDSINFNGGTFDVKNSNDPLGSIADTLQKLLKINDEARNYNLKLPFRFVIGGEYYTKDMRNDFSLLFTGQLFNGYFEPAVSVAYTRFVSGHFSVKANYTWIKDAPVNFGIAMAVNFHPFQFYLYSDNVPGLFQWDQQKYVQAGFGLNIRLAPRNTRKSPHNPDNIHNLRPDIVR